MLVVLFMRSKCVRSTPVIHVIRQTQFVCAHFSGMSDYYCEQLRGFLVSRQQQTAFGRVSESNSSHAGSRVALRPSLSCQPPP
jgi:hypothetical protein